MSIRVFTRLVVWVVAFQFFSNVAAAVHVIPVGDYAFFLLGVIWFVFRWTTQRS